MSPPQLSLAQHIALLPSDAQEEALKDIDPTELQYDWSFWGRPNQILPDDNSWHVALLIAGRGFGKTLAGNQWVRKQALEKPGSRGILTARTAADIRDTVVMGESGILAVHPPSERPEWKPSNRLLVWPNGSTALAISADNPDLLRGIQSTWSLADEIATWDYTTDSSGLTAWDNLLIATRLGDNPQIVAMTTPKKTAFMRDLVKKANDHHRWIIRTGSTYENAGNLSQNYIDSITGLYEGTSLAAQELHGEMFDGDLEGTLWTIDTLESTRVSTAPDAPLQIVVGVDPSVAERPRDVCGIVVAASTTERNSFARHLYILQDASIHGSPALWAKKVVETANKYSAPVVVEVNQGGALVRNAINNIDPNIRVLEVTATQSKRTRAEPIAMLFEQGRGHMVNHHVELENELSTWQPEITKKSPDRLDAMVWAATALLQGTKKGSIISSRIRARSPRGSVPRVRPSNGAIIRMPRR